MVAKKDAFFTEAIKDLKKEIKEPILKRPFDILLSSFGIMFFSPLGILFSLAIWLESGRPIFYLQERVGRYGKVFRAIKFRSMINDAERNVGPIQAKENDPRTTKVGRILRATAMDELPQLINILKGDMSFVGPRALRPDELEVRTSNPHPMSIEEIPGFKERCMVTPGLTGIAQVYAPRDVSRRHKFKYDLTYVKNQGLLLDLKLIFLSFWITLRGKWESRQRKI